MHPHRGPRPPIQLPLIGSGRAQNINERQLANIIEDLVEAPQTARLPRCVESRITSMAAKNSARIASLSVSRPSTISNGDFESEPNQGDEISTVADRTHRIFRELSSKYQKALAEKDKELAELKTSQASTAPGGQKYNLLHNELEWTKGEMRNLQTKINSLVKLLDRAGASLRNSEKQSPRGQEDPEDGVPLTGRVDWAPLRYVMRDLFIQDRSDDQVVSSVAKYIQKLTTQVVTLEAAGEGTNSRFIELENQKDALMKTINQQKREIESLKEELARVNRSGYGSDISEIATIRQEFEVERAKLLHQVTTLETAMRNTVDSRPFFVALGKGLAVPPFLRHDGRIKNIALSKRIVENVIVSLWLTRFVPTLQRCPALEEAGLTVEVRKRGVAAILEVFDSTAVLSKALEKMFAAEGLMMIPKDLGKSDMSPEESRMSSSAGDIRYSLGGSKMASISPANFFSLVDYDNLSLWSIRRADIRKLLSFQDHLARFFMELCKPDKLPLVFGAYASATGVGTPPVADVSRQARATLLLCAPQGATLMRPAATMPSEVAEITYSLMDGCDRYSFDADVELFRRIVKGQLPESAFYDQMIMLQKLRVALLQSAVAEREEAREAAGLETSRRGSFGSESPEEHDEAKLSSRPTVSSVLRMLRKFFPSKTADEFRLLQRALLLDVRAISLNSEEAFVHRGALEGMGTVSESHMSLPVDVRQLFASNDSGNQGYFLESIRNQHLESLSTYMAEVQVAILSLLNSDAQSVSSGNYLAVSPPPRGNNLSRHKRSSFLQQRGSHQTAPLILIRDRLADIDPMKPRTDINLYLYHLIQLMFTDRQRINSPDADLIHKVCEDWFEPPLCYHPINLEELAKYCALVLCKRCGPASPQGSSPAHPATRVVE